MCESVSVQKLTQPDKISTTICEIARTKNAPSGTIKAGNMLMCCVMHIQGIRKGIMQ